MQTPSRVAAGPAVPAIPRIALSGPVRAGPPANDFQTVQAPCIRLVPWVPFPGEYR